MQKILFIKIFLVIFLSNSFAQTKKNTWMELNLLGKVKSVIENTYKAVEDSGKIKNGERKYGITFIFNKIGNLIESSTSSRFMQNKDTTIYDDFENKKEVIEYNHNGIISRKYAYNYNEKGKLIEQNWYNTSGIIIRKITYKYDDKGNKIEENIFDPIEKLSFKSTYKYDNKGNEIEWNTLNPLDESLKYKFTYKYDDKGNKIERKYFNSDGTPSTRDTYTYDNKGNEIEVNNYAKDGSLYIKSTYKYSFDKNINWIKKIEYQNSKPITITEREIIYF